jgi:type I restriction enzyme S subunit
MPRLGTDDALKALLPLPPIAEQKRIVEKIKSMMAVCDELEVQQKKRHETRLHLNNSAIDKLLTSQTPKEFTANWQRICDSFDVLYDHPDTVDNLRQAILQLAVQGKLGTQNSNDKPATTLLAKIALEKQKLSKERSTQPNIIPKSSESDQRTINLPTGWELIPLGEIIWLISGQHVEMSDYNTDGVGIPYLTGPIDFGERYPCISKWTEKPKTIANLNDILITVKGAGLGKNNVVNIEKLCISRQLMAIRCVGVSTEYIHLFIRSKYDYFQSIGVGIAIPGIGRDAILKMPCPLPPLAEQSRIVAKVDQLMALCDQLQTQLKQAQETSAKLTAAAVANLVSPNQ